jgi:hypothetical protein
MGENKSNRIVINTIDRNGIRCDFFLWYIVIVLFHLLKELTIAEKKD